VTVILLLARKRSAGQSKSVVRHPTFACYLDIVAELTSLTIDLGAIVQEFFKVSTIEDTVSGGSRVVDDELVFCRGSPRCCGLEYQGVSLLRR
jgi:hypothetical protein